MCNETAYCESLKCGYEWEPSFLIGRISCPCCLGFEDCLIDDDGDMYQSDSEEHGTYFTQNGKC
jgi:hypothetical protein